MWEKLLYNKKKTKSQEKNNGQINMQLQKYPIEYKNMKSGQNALVIRRMQINTNTRY